MSYDDAFLFLSGALTASVLTGIITILLSNRTPDMSRTAFTGDQIEMLNRLLDENDVTLTKKD